MNRKLTCLTLAATGCLLQFGCGTVSFRDAVAAGIFDFISGTATGILSGLVPLPTA